MKIFYYIFSILVLSFFISYSQTYEWAFNISNKSSTCKTSGHDVAVDDSGNVYTVGFLWGTNDFDPGPGIANRSSIGKQGGYLAKYNSNHIFQWAFSINSTLGFVNIYSVRTDASGNVYIAGNLFNSTSDLDPDSGVVNLTADLFIAKYSNTGSYIWAKQITSLSPQSNGDQIKMVIDHSANIYVTSFFQGTNDFDPGNGIANLTSSQFDVFFAKYDSSGIFQWVNKIGGGGDEMYSSLTLDDSANIYVIGNFQNSADFDPGHGVANLQSMGSVSAFVAKYDSSGNYNWALKLDSTSWDGNVIATDHWGNFYISVNFRGTIDCDPGPGIVNLSTISHAGDAILAKYNSSGIYVWAINFNSSKLASVSDLEIDRNGNLNACGYFLNGVDFNPGPASASFYASAGIDGFIARYSTSGSFLSAFNIGWNRDDNANGLALDNFGNIYVTGYFNNIVDFDPGSGVANLSSVYSPPFPFYDQQAYVAKYSNPVVLPIELLSFSGRNKGDKNFLEWATATEINNSGFEIERSEYGIDYDKIGFIVGNGNSTEIHNYSFVDNFIKKNYYYRLKQIDYDGNFSYSDILLIQKETDNNSFVILPNPAREKIFIYLYENSGNINELKLMDVSGKVFNCPVQMIKPAWYEFDLQGLASGVYILQLQNDKSYGVCRFVKI